MVERLDALEALVQEHHVHNLEAQRTQSHRLQALAGQQAITTKDIRELKRKCQRNSNEGESALAERLCGLEQRYNILEASITNMSHDTENLMADLKKLRDEAEETDFFTLPHSLFENVGMENEKELVVQKLEQDHEHELDIGQEDASGDTSKQALPPDSSKGVCLRDSDVLGERASSLAFFFDDSVWDASFFIGLTSRRSSFLTLLILIVNMAAQLFFSFLINQNLGNLSDISLSDSDLDDFLQWRAGPAHHASHYDELTDTSLATRVCESYGAAVVASTQFSGHSDFNTYEGSGASEFYAGPGLCMLCLLVWFCVVAKDSLQLVSLLAALWGVKSRAPTVVAKEDEGLKVERVHCGRITVMGLLVVVPRCAINLVLLSTGASFLMYTASMKDLILNAIALGFILDIDELFFTFVPLHVQSLVQQTQSLALPRGWFVVRPLLLLSVTVLCGVYYAGTMVDLLNRMSIAQDLMCLGNTNFIYAIDPFSGVITTTSTSDSTVVLTGDAPYVIDAVFQAAGLSHESVLTNYDSLVGADLLWYLDDASIYLYSEEVQDVLTIYKASEDAAEEFLECEDEASKTPAYVQRLQELVQRTVSSCADVVDLCVTNVYVREFCSHTCSCSDMNAGLFLRSSCASACDTMIMAEVTAQETEMFYVNETETYCAYQDGNTSWVQLFFSDLQRYLVQEGYVNMTQAGTYQWTQSYASLFEKSTSGYLALLDVNMDLSKWLNLDNYTSACNAIWYFDNMFGTTLCLSASSLSANQGTLRGLCPRECGLCVDGDATLALTTDLELLELYNLQHKDFEHHLINFELMSLDQDGLNLECGRTVYGSTFQSSCSSGHHCVATNFTVGSSGDFVLDLCGSLQMDSWKTTVSVFDVDSGNEVTASYRDCCEPFAHLTVTLDAGKNYQVTISGSEGGTFSLELWCCGVGGNDCSDSCT